MEELDGDTVRLTNDSGQEAARDIVQFVPFQGFLERGLNSQMSRLHLAKEVLAEIPEQFTSYMKANRIVPRPRSQTTQQQQQQQTTTVMDPENITAAMF